MGRLHFLVQVLPWRAISAMQRGPKHLVSADSFVKESSLEGHGFYGALLCLFHCALLRRVGKQGESLQIREVSKRHQMSIKLCSAWVLVRQQHSLDKLGKDNHCKTFLQAQTPLGSLVIGQQNWGPMVDA